MDSPLPSPDRADPSQGDRVAIIGVAGRFPGAESVPALWRMLERGESGLARAPADPHGPVRSCFALAGKECFDAAFFGFAPSEAALMDPQHRLFLETAWHAMEDAGYGGGDLPVTGVFAAAGFNDYVLRHVGPRSYAEGAAERFAMQIGNDKDFLASRAAHLLDLTGPASVVQSACSSGLLCVHQAVQSLLQGEIAMALAGAVSVSMDLEEGYRADPGGPMSPTGTIAPFSAGADGIVGGNGVAALVLKRLDDALADRDHVYAVIEASAANNDGRDRAGFTAPGVAGQARVLAEALGLGGLSADDVSYIEAHGTGTPIGDPIEVEAIKRVYGAGRTPCLIGSVKANVGHLNTVAGLAGLLKAVLVVRSGLVPPTLNLAGVNPLLALDGTRFSICDRPTALPEDGGRRAAVSSFGFGGTNVHVLLGPPPAARSGADDRTPVLLGWSARTEEDRAALGRRLADAWAAGAWAADAGAANARNDGPGRPLADDAGTLLHGRRRFAHRHAVVAADAGEAARRIEAGALIRPRRAGGAPGPLPGPLVFLFPGQGAQFAGMGAPLHRSHRGFRDRIDRCAALLEPLLGRDLRGLLHGSDDAALVPTLHSQLALFATEHALAGTLIEAGLRPAALLGHSVGEYVAACLAGVFSLEDALRLVHARGRLMAGLPPAGMLAVQAGPERLEPHLTDALSLAAVNRADRCVVAGTPDALDSLMENLRRDGVASRRLAVSHGFHSHLMEPILDSFAAVCRTVAFDRPSLPVLSNADGGLADPDAIATPGYWVRHLRRTVRFADNVEALRRHWPDATALELGPGSGCTATIGRAGGLTALPTMVTRDSQTTDLLAALGQLWVDGHDMDPGLPTLGRAWRRVPLPGYPFQRVRHLPPPLPEQAAPSPDRVLPPDERFFVPQWRSLPHRPFAPSSPARRGAAARPLLLFLPGHPFPIPEDATAIRVRPGPGYREDPDGSVHLRPGNAADFRRLAARLKEQGIRDALCLFGWLHGGSPADDKANGHDSLVRLAQTLLPAGIVGHLLLLTDRLAVIAGTETPRCEQALALGVLRAIPFERPGVQASWLDADRLPDSATLARIDARRRSDPALHALSLAARNGRLWERRLVPAALPENGDAPHPVRPGGTYVVTGGTGGLGLELLRRLARHRCHLVVIARGLDAALCADPSRHPVFADALAHGATLALVAGSADDRSLLDGVAADLLRQGRPANGIFHLAGRYVPQTLQDLTLAERDTNHRAKLLGAQALLAAFAPHAPDFLVNFSSLAGETSGYGNADYMAANLALDFLAESGTAPFPVVTIGWDNWEKLGALGEAAAASGDGALFLGSDGRAIAAEDGFAALWRILRGGHAHALVSPTAIDRRLREVDHAARARRGQGAEPPNPAPGVAALPPDGPPLERLALLLFARTLGIETLGPSDDFLQLGGDSIMAVRLLSRLRAILQAEFALPDFLANRTPAQLARRLDAIPGAATTALAYLHIQSLPEHDRQSLRRHAGPA